MTQRQTQRQTVIVNVAPKRKKRSTKRRAPVRRPPVIQFPQPVIQVVQERYFPGVPPNPPPQAPYQPPVLPKVTTSTTAFGTQTVEPAFVSGTGTQVNFDQDIEMQTMRRRPTLSDFNALDVNIDPVQSSDFGIQSVASTFTSSAQTMNAGVAPSVDMTPSFTEVAAPRRTRLLQQVATLGIRGAQNLTTAQLESILESDNPVTQANRFKKGKAIAAPLSAVASPFKQKRPK
jgi:hypothetical protein